MYTLNYLTFKNQIDERCITIVYHVEENVLKNVPSLN